MTTLTALIQLKPSVKKEDIEKTELVRVVNDIKRKVKIPMCEMQTMILRNILLVVSCPFQECWVNPEVSSRFCSVSV